MVFVWLLVVVLGANYTVLVLPIAEDIVITVFALES